MLETIREFAREQLELNADDLARLRDGVIRFGVAFARAAEPAWHAGGQKEWLLRFDEDLGNLREAMRWALDDGRGNDALQIVARLAWLWQERGYFEEAEAWLDAALDTAPDAEPGLRGYSEFCVGLFAFEKGDIERGVARTRLSLPLLERGGETHAHIYAVCRLAESLTDVDEASALAESAEREARLLGNGYLLATALESRANIESARGNPGTARELLLEAWEAHSRTVDRIHTLHGLAQLKLPDGDLERAAELLHKALALSSEQDFTRDKAIMSLSLGQVELLRGRPEDAGPYLEEAMRLSDESGARSILGSALVGLAALEAARDETTAAVARWTRAAAVLADMGSPRSRADLAIEARYLEPLRAHIVGKPGR